MGTFDWYSWDIMEPICYLMGFSNFTFGYLFYMSMKRDLELTNFHEILTRRFTERACRRAGIDLEKHRQLEHEIAEINHALQSLNV